MRIMGKGSGDAGSSGRPVAGMRLDKAGRLGFVQARSPMQKIETIAAMREAAAELRRAGRKIAFVPTLGALHAGHASLIRLAKEEGRAVVVSAFVNPLQFGASEDYTKYPRTPGPDDMLAEKEGADVLFTPTVEEMFPKGFSSVVQEDTISKPLCGVVRPTLFRGTLTCWVKLLNIILP